jgi:pimeloyl-ACP methyl ester carboxylesterase
MVSQIFGTNKQYRKTISMKTTLKIIGHIFKWILILLIVIFSVATLVGGSWLQTMLLWMLCLVIAWWPHHFRDRWSRGVSLVVRLVLIVVLFVVSFTAFKPEPKSSIYLSEEGRSALMEIYDRKMADWPAGTQDIYIKTRYGKVHVLACGSPGNPALVMVHAASMGAHSWAENLEPLLDHYRVYSIDNIGEGNKSELSDPLVYPSNQEEIADHLAFILDELDIRKAVLFGASNGGFVTACLASYYPERAEALCLFGPMGLTKLTGGSIMMLSIATMYPFQFVRDRVANWAIGEDPYVKRKYGDWFDCIMRGTVPSVAGPVPMTDGQKAKMELPVLLFLGTRDRIVGKVETARRAAEVYPNIRIEVLESGHLVAVEHAEKVNSVVKEFLGL